MEDISKKQDTEKAKEVTNIDNKSKVDAMNAKEKERKDKEVEEKADTKVLDDMISKNAKEAVVKDTQGEESKVKKETEKKIAAKIDPLNPNPASKEPTEKT